MKALVVGGHGLMGRWFCSFLESMGHEVLTVDPAGPTKGFRRAPTVAAGLAGLGPRDLCLVATPMEHAAQVLAEVRAARTKALVVDVCSLKAPVRAEVRALAKQGAKVASLHPMWGPDAVLLSDKNLLVLDCGSRAAVREAKALFRGTAVRITELPLEQHDALMGWALGLPHVLNLAFGHALARSGLRPEDLEHLGGPTMRTQLKVARGVARENKALYHAIQALNPHTPTVHGALRDGLEQFHKALGNPARFRALMARCEAYFDDFPAAPAPRPRARAKRKGAKP
jgi:chorismate mutase / prephenate dehydrogenase